MVYTQLSGIDREKLSGGGAGEFQIRNETYWFGHGGKTNGTVWEPNYRVKSEGSRRGQRAGAQLEYLHSTSGEGSMLVLDSYRR